jgi:hypothetical protein
MGSAVLRSSAAAAFLLLPAIALGQQKDVTPRRDIDPWDRAQVQQVQAKRWTKGGVDVERTRTVTGGVPGKQSCSTTVGPAAPAQAQPRFGPQPKPQTVVVTGNVINVCN